MPNTKGLSFDLDSLNTFVSFQFGAAQTAGGGTAGSETIEAEELKPTQVTINTQGVQNEESISFISRK